MIVFRIASLFPFEKKIEIVSKTAYKKYALALSFGKLVKSALSAYLNLSTSTIVECLANIHSTKFFISNCTLDILNAL